MCSPLFFVGADGYHRDGIGRRMEVGPVRTPIGSELYLESGFLSGLEAMSEMRELLDEIYASTTQEPEEGQVRLKET